MNRRVISRGRSVLLYSMLLSILALGGSAWAGGRTVTTSSVIPLYDSIIFDSNTNSNVKLSGWVHIVISVTQPDPYLSGDPYRTDIYANLPAMDVLAVSSSTSSYLAHGAGNTTVQFTDIAVPPNPIRVSGFELRSLQPGVPPNPIRFDLNLTLNFAALGDSSQSYATAVQP